eukprot:2939286-Amphidinium_carterae.1
MSVTNVIITFKEVTTKNIPRKVIEDEWVRVSMTMSMKSQWILMIKTVNVEAGIWSGTQFDSGGAGWLPTYSAGAQVESISWQDQRISTDLTIASVRARIERERSSSKLLPPIRSSHDSRPIPHDSIEVC